MNQGLYIGLTGRMGSGKGEVAKILKKQDFTYISLSDIVREEVARRGKEVNRAEMQDIGNSLRNAGGAGVLGKMVREKVTGSNQNKWVIDGIRNPAEVEELRKMPGFTLVAIDSPVESILTRLESRSRQTDLAGKEELKKRLDREWGIGEPPEGQRVGPCMELADVTIVNRQGLKELRKAVFNFLESLQHR